MSSTRERALDAAVTLVGTEGVRALTHGRVDAAASLPPGSTSNHFRTRAALLAGVIEWMAVQERADAGIPEIHSREQLIGALTRMIEAQSGPLAARTRARYALFLEADEDAAGPLRAQRAGMEQWVRGILNELGGEAAAAHTAFLMATGDGLLLHRITVDPEAPIEAAITQAVTAALRA
ncbi:TetR family transcriptional regulator [Microbacterium sp. LTA6]|uniref:TetR/AcrR family transcriptional regulator n=1 Tax=unclassified Microbacterium TaxID=2609290 RepID=UPI0031390BFA